LSRASNGQRKHQPNSECRAQIERHGSTFSTRLPLKRVSSACDNCPPRRCQLTLCLLNHCYSPRFYCHLGFALRAYAPSRFGTPCANTSKQASKVRRKTNSPKPKRNRSKRRRPKHKPDPKTGRRATVQSPSGHRTRARRVAKQHRSHLPQRRAHPSHSRQRACQRHEPQPKPRWRHLPSQRHPPLPKRPTPHPVRSPASCSSGLVPVNRKNPSLHPQAPAFRNACSART
jgi:hypothetical protein